VSGSGAEAPDRDQRPVHRERRDDGVDARTVRQARVDHRTRFVDAAAHARDDLLDDLHEVGVVVEGHLGQFQPAAPLDVHLVERVNQDVGNGRVVQQRLERAEAEHFVLDVEHQVMPLLLVQHDAFFFDDALNQQRQLVLELLGGQPLQPLQIDPVEDHLVHGLLQFLVGLLRHFRQVVVLTLLVGSG
jgi:hypothetical protein